MYARLLLAAIVVPAFALCAQPQSSAAPSGVAIAATARGARLDHRHARSTSIDGKRFEITPARSNDVTRLERVRSRSIPRVLDDEARTAEDAIVNARRFNPYLTQAGGAWTAHGESAGSAYRAKRATETPDAPPILPTVNRWSGCWWLALFAGAQFCY